MTSEVLGQQRKSSAQLKRFLLRPQLCCRNGKLRRSHEGAQPACEMQRRLLPPSPCAERAILGKDASENPEFRGSGVLMAHLVKWVLSEVSGGWTSGNATNKCSLTKTGFQFYYLPAVYIVVFITGFLGNSVVYPLKSLGRLKKKNAVYISALVWIVVVAGISPILFYSGTGVRKNKTTTCYDTTQDDYLRSYFIYSMCTTVFLFCIPFILILGCYGLIVKALIYKDLDNSPLRRKSIYLVIIVLAVFAVSYLPFHVMKNLNLRARLDFQTPEMCAFNNRVYATYQVTRGLASLNSCVDPILYFLAGDTFRRRLSRATRKASRRSELNMQSKSEDMTLSILSECKQNGDTSL
ncbi:hypothetical protein lerEdw1_008194 [Lerista edwardsae]|nr:hypothetical protein lerEdw1_008194 [Lerista edwardsae]